MAPTRKWLGYIIEGLTTPRPEPEKRYSLPSVERFPIKDSFYCNKCGIHFIDLVEYRAHFRISRHAASPSVSEDLQEEQPKIVNGQVQVCCIDGQYLIFPALIANKKALRAMSTELLYKKLAELNHSLVLLIMLRSGRFAAGIFDLKGNTIVTKAFKKYTVRAGQGFSQSKAGGSRGYNSAGSLIRNQNEAKLTEEIAEILQSWGGHIEECKLFFWNFTPHGQSSLFSEKGPIGHLKARFSEYPFETFDPSLAELLRARDMLLLGTKMDLTLQEQVQQGSK